MIVHKKIKQRSLEWHELKWGKIGGTLSKGLFVNSDTLFIDILSQHLEDFEPTDGFSNEHTERGILNEPFAIEFLNKYTGLEFKEFGWLQSEKNELLGISPDGLTEDLKIGCEIKCFSRKKHTEVILNNEIPLENIHQVIHYFTVNPSLEKLYFCAFRPESVKNFIKEITLETKVNIGTKKTPKIMTVEAVRDYSLEKAEELLQKINEYKSNLEF